MEKIRIYAELKTINKLYDILKKGDSIEIYGSDVVYKINDKIDAQKLNLLCNYTLDYNTDIIDIINGVKEAIYYNRYKTYYYTTVYTTIF